MAKYLYYLQTLCQPVRRKKTVFIRRIWKARLRVVDTIYKRYESKSWWELTSESLHESFLHSRVRFKREQELHMRVDESGEARVFSSLVSWSNEKKVRLDSWWELASESLHESFLNFLVLVKREQELNKSCSIVPVTSQPHYIIM